MPVLFTRRSVIIDFYRQFWMHTTSEQRASLSENAANLSNHMGCRVTVDDLIDKLLWMANGNRAILRL